MKSADSAPSEMARHRCIGIRQGDPAYGVWRLASGKRMETVKVRGPLSTNDGEIAVNWALAGHGIVMRAEVADPGLGHPRELVNRIAACWATRRTRLRSPCAIAILDFC